MVRPSLFLLVYVRGFLNGRAEWSCKSMLTKHAYALVLEDEHAGTNGSCRQAA